MPDAFGVCEVESSQDYEEAFIEDNCNHCSYYFEEQSGECSEHDIEDEDGNIVISCRVRSQCPCYTDGLFCVSWPCAAGHSKPSDSYGDGEDFSLPPMAFAVNLSPRSFTLFEINAWVQDVSCDTGIWRATDRLTAINVHSNESVCWGNENSTPRSLPEAVATYSDTGANEDLLPVSSFKANISQARSQKPQHPVTGSLVGPGYDALLIATVAETPAAFLLLTASGAAATDGLIALGLTSTSHTFEDGTTVNAYLTDPLVNGRSWLLVNDPKTLENEDYDGRGLLLGQLQSTAFPPCDSPAPSSSAPAVLAAC
jgi:hypothetical protein